MVYHSSSNGLRLLFHRKDREGREQSFVPALKDWSSFPLSAHKYSQDSCLLPLSHEHRMMFVEKVLRVLRSPLVSVAPKASKSSY